MDWLAVAAFAFGAIIGWWAGMPDDPEKYKPKDGFDP